MRNKPKQNTGLIFAGIGATLILGVIAGVMIYLINKNEIVTPEPQASSCCSCEWSVEIGRSGEQVISKAVGLVSGSSCSYPDIAPFLGNYNPTSCAPARATEVFSELPPGLAEDALINAVETRDICTGGCTFYTSDPIMPPPEINDENNTVMFTAYFELRYAIEPHTEYQKAEMIISYPNDTNSPEPIPSTSLELVTTRDEGEESGSEDPLIIKVYRATFDTTWDTVLNTDVPGIYTVSFRAQDNSPEGTWTAASQCKREFEVISSIPEGNYCYSLDIAPMEGDSPLDVTLTADAGTPEDDPTAVFSWELDLNCNGTIDEGEGSNAEEFATPRDTPSITRTFVIPEGRTMADCSAKVKVVVKDGEQTLADLTPGSCTASISVTKLLDGETCGNGICDSGETCDTDGNIVCPAETPLQSGFVCRESCTYCGDGELDEGETCDPGATVGQTGYSPVCNSDCTTNTIPESCGNGVLDTGEECDPDIPVGQNGYNANCQIDCTINDELPGCGNGVLDPGEECDPAIAPGSAGYSQYCQSNCEINTQQPQPTLSGQLDIIQQTAQCVELVSPKNLTPVTVTITNGTANPYKINAISDTLPQGFAYVSGSSTINGASNTSDTGVVLEMSGSSQLVTWNNSGAGWTLSSGQILTLTFNAVAGSSSTIGQQTNTVTVTPADGNPIPNNYSFTVAQVCTQPQTGIFNRNVVIILGGIILLLLAGMAYYTGFGTHELARAIKNGSDNGKLLILRLSQPQKYQELKIQQTALKNIKKKTDAKTRKQ